MKHGRNSFLVKIIALFVAFSLTGLAGCSLFSKKSVNVTDQLKGKVEKYTRGVKKVSSDVKSFIESLEKPYYTTADVTDFSAKTTSLLNQLSSTETNLGKANNYLEKLRASSAKDFSQFVEIKSAEIDFLRRLTVKDKKILTKLQNFLTSVSALFQFVDQVKEAQGKQVQIADINAARIKERSISQEVLTTLLFNKALAEASGSTGTSSSTTSSTTSSSTTSGSSSASSTSSSSTEQTPDWVYEILNYDNQSNYLIDSIEGQSQKLINLYESLYQLDKRINFDNTAKLVSAVQLVKNDSADLKRSMVNVNGNITHRRKLWSEYQDLYAEAAPLRKSLAYLRSAIANRPSGVSTGSPEAQSVLQQEQELSRELQTKDQQMKDLKNQMDELEKTFATELSPGLDDDLYRYGGALFGLIRVNDTVSSGLMSEIKTWEENNIGELIEERSKLASAASYLAYRAKKVYAKARELATR